MSVAFWSEIITTKKPFATQPPEGYVMNLQNVAVTNIDKTVNIFACSDAISGDKLNALISVLSAKSPHAILSLVFGYDVPVTFRVEGCSKAEVHISGYYQPIGDGEDSEDSEEEGDDFDEEAYMNTLTNADGSLNAEGKMIIGGGDMGSGSEDDEESDSEDERVDADFIKKMLAQNNGGKSEANTAIESDSEEEEEEEVPVPKKSKVTTPAGKKSNQNTPASKGKGAAPKSNQKNQKSGEKRKR
jgi:hypothetical protein